MKTKFIAIALASCCFLAGCTNIKGQQQQQIPQLPISQPLQVSDAMYSKMSPEQQIKVDRARKQQQDSMRQHMQGNPMLEKQIQRYNGR